MSIVGSLYILIAVASAFVSGMYTCLGYVIKTATSEADRERIMESVAVLGPYISLEKITEAKVFWLVVSVIMTLIGILCLL